MLSWEASRPTAYRPGRSSDELEGPRPGGFPAVIEHLRDAEERRFFDKPGWYRDSFWSFPYSIPPD
jgi:hypothetical protein